MINQSKPHGTEKYDQNYGIGYRVGHDDFSPYERVNKLRKVFLDRKFNIDIQRARLITEVYKNNPDMPVKLKTAYSLKNILENVDIEIYDDELIIGEEADQMMKADNEVYAELMQLVAGQMD